MDNLAVVHLVTDLRQSAGGIAATVPALASALCDHGVENRFVTCVHDPDFEWRDSTTCISTGGLLHRAELEAGIRGAIRDIPKGYKIVLHSHGLWHTLNHSGIRVASRDGLASLISVHGMLLPWARNHKKWRKDVAWMLFQRRDLNRVNGVHVTSEAEADTVAEIGLSLRPHLIEFGIVIPEDLLPIPQGRPAKTLLFLGRLHPVKNLEGLIRAFVLAAPKDFRLRLVGPDENNYRAKLLALIDELGAGHFIEISGPVYGAEKQREIASAHALVLPSFTENFGAVVAESLAMARPVIASTGAPWEILESERCGWWIDPDIESLTNALVLLMATPQTELFAMGTRGRAYVARNLHWKSVSKRMLDLYVSLLR